VSRIKGDLLRPESGEGVEAAGGAARRANYGQSEGKPGVVVHGARDHVHGKRHMAAKGHSKYGQGNGDEWFMNGV
jgi:hypothetical protein